MLSTGPFAAIVNGESSRFRPDFAPARLRFGLHLSRRAGRLPRRGGHADQHRVALWGCGGTHAGVHVAGPGPVGGPRVGAARRPAELMSGCMYHAPDVLRGLSPNILP